MIALRSNYVRRVLCILNDIFYEIINNHAFIYLAVDETRKALDELEARGRPKRDTDPEDMERRLAVLKNSAARFAKMRESVNAIMTKVKTKLKAVRKEITG